MEQQSSFQIPINLSFLKLINFKDFSRIFQKVGTLLVDSLIIICPISYKYQRNVRYSLIENVLKIFEVLTCCQTMIKIELLNQQQKLHPTC